jgi:hypothetical protein
MVICFLVVSWPVEAADALLQKLVTSRRLDLGRWPAGRLQQLLTTCCPSALKEACQRLTSANGQEGGQQPADKS